MRKHFFHGLIVIFICAGLSACDWASDFPEGAEPGEEPEAAGAESPEGDGTAGEDAAPAPSDESGAADNNAALMLFQLVLDKKE